MPPGSCRVGVDVGGTFTDVVVVTDGRVAVSKIPSTPDAPDDGVLAGLQAGLDDAIAPTDVEVLSHGTTVATNAILEGGWAETALVTTRGFRDVLEIGRQTRPSLYDLAADTPDPIVPRDRRFEVEERLDERGNVLTPLTTAEVDRVAAELVAAEPEAIAIALLFAFENPTHERTLEEELRDRGIDTPISRSSLVHPEIREFERTLATSVNAALHPVLSTYVQRLTDRLDAFGLGAELSMMQSNGGTVAARRLVERPVRALLSGPAAGVNGAAHVADLVGERDVVTMDMGGTSCDVSLVTGGTPTVSTDVTVGPYPVSVPMVDMHTIGAGGGSVAWLDAGDALRVGPRSAGADPGPICYGRGGTAPTVTDAQALLGRIDPGRIASGHPVGHEALADRFRASLAHPMGTDTMAAAAGVVEVADAAMARAVRVVTVERGHDPRNLALVAYGGAGPLHAPSVAVSLDVPRVVVPPSAGALSALGLLVADRLYDFARSRVRPLERIEPESLDDTFAEFSDRGRDRLRSDGIAEDRIELERSLDLRYLGQSYEVGVPAPADLVEDGFDGLISRFHTRHERQYGHNSPDEPVELVTVRLRARGRIDPPVLGIAAQDAHSRDVDERTQRAVHFDGGRLETPVYNRPDLPIDAELTGPAIVEGAGSTLAVPPGQTAAVHSSGSIVVEVDP